MRSRTNTASPALCIGLVSPGLVLLVLAAYLPVLDNGFVNWDDDKNFLENFHFRGLGPSQWKWAWSTFWFGVYQPLAWLLFGFQYECWQLDPRGFHLTSLILHAVNAVVLYVLTLVLLGRSQVEFYRQRRGTCSVVAGVAVGMFMVHPLRVEPVVWVSGQPYLPCAMFSMLSVLAYLRAFGAGSRRVRGWLFVSFILFVTALLFHAVAVSLPAVLLILDVYPLGRLGDGGAGKTGSGSRNAWVEKLPFVLVSVAFVVVAIAARKQSLDVVERNSPSASIAQACYGIWFYLWKTLLPWNLIAVYPAPVRIDWQSLPFLAAIVSTVAVSVVVYAMRRRLPGMLAAWLSYVVILAPNSGLIRINDQIAADRYSYLSMMGMVVATAGIACWLLEMTRWRRVPAWILVFGVLLLLMEIGLTREQCRTWRDSETLWTHAVSHGAASSSLAHYNLGLELFHRGRLQGAVDHYKDALRLSPRDVVVHHNLGVALQRQGKLEAAAVRYAHALHLDPDYLDSHYNLGLIFSEQGNFKAAAIQYNDVLRLDPGFASAHHNLGVDLYRQGKLAEAAVHYNEALRHNNGRPDTHQNLAAVLSDQGMLDEANAHRAEAIRLRREFAHMRKKSGYDSSR